MVELMFFWWCWSRWGCGNQVKFWGGRRRSGEVKSGDVWVEQRVKRWGGGVTQQEKGWNCFAVWYWKRVPSLVKDAQIRST